MNEFFSQMPKRPPNILHEPDRRIKNVIQLRFILVDRGEAGNTNNFIFSRMNVFESDTRKLEINFG